MGLDVLCEKPLALNATLAARCVEYARRVGRKLKVGANHRFWRGVRRILSAVEAGEIGVIERMDTEIGYRLPDVRSDWYREKEHAGGGTIIDNCPHLMDVVSQLLEVADGDRIRRVVCSATHDDLGLGVEDRASGLMISEKGRAVSLSSTWADGDYRMNLDIRGSHGRLLLTGFDRLTMETAEGTTELDFSDCPPLESWELDVQAFLDSIQLDRAPTGSGDDGVRSIAIIDALYRAADEKREQTVG